jgi:DNA-binding MarR family transcriptional regulator
MTNRRIRGETAARAELHRRAAHTKGLDARREGARRKRSHRRPSDLGRHPDGSPESVPTDPGSGLEGFLDVLDRERLAPVEVLVLLRIAATESTLGELAAVLDREAMTIRRTVGDLIGRGLVRQRSAARGSVLEVMPTGRRLLDRLTELDLLQSAEA